MNIGNLLKKYRIKQGKSQREFAEDVLTQSYYSKVEQNLNQITAQNLIKLLKQNRIHLQEFFKQADKEDNKAQHELQQISQMIVQAYYANDLRKMEQISYLINASSLSSNEKEDQLLMISGFIELMDDKKIQSDKELQNKIKSKVFDIPDFNQNKLMLYCDFMRFYDLNSNLIITQTILKQYENSNNSDIQKLLLAIITNLVIIAIEEDRFNEVVIMVNYAKKIETIPDIFFYKLVLSFFENIGNYKITQNLLYQNKARGIIKAVNDAGMKRYSKELSQFMEKYS